MEIYEFTVKEDDERLDKFLSRHIPDISRSKIQQAVKDGQVLVNGQAVKANYKLKEDDHVRMEYEEEVLELVSEEVPLDIIYEDDTVLVLNKPSGLVVHPAPGHPDGTLVNRLLAHTSRLSDINGEFRPGIVHRLDKDTSGILVVAKTNQAHEDLAQQFKLNLPLREYAALVHGHMDSPKGTINMPLGRDPHNRIKFAVQPDGKASVTHFKVEKEFKSLSLLKVQLETGRTHQIRVHLSHIDHPVYGDYLYGSPQKLADDRYCLHAKRIGFRHPVTQEWMEFETELPDFFQKILDESL